MAEYEIDSRPFFAMLHMFLRHDGDEQAMAQMSEVLKWAVENTSTLLKVTTKEEKRLLLLVFAYWNKHDVGISRDALIQLIHINTQPEVLLHLMDEYDRIEDELTIIPVADLHLYLDQRIQDWEKNRVSIRLDIASQINAGSFQFQDREKTVMAGSRDAIKFLNQEFSKGLLFNDQPVAGGVLTGIASVMQDEYEKAQRERACNRLLIPTGINLIDNQYGGLRRKEMVGLLGFTSQRKSYIARTIAYWAAYHQFRVVHIPFESDMKMERNIYVVMHAALCASGHAITRARLEKGNLTPEESQLLFEQVVPDFEEVVGKNLIVQEPKTRSWPDAQAIVQTAIDDGPVDLVVIDYLTLMSTPGTKDEKQDKVNIIQDAKRFTMTANDGQGLCLVTPVQGNRDGLEEAGGRDGEWEAHRIYQYSEMEKSLDTIFYTWFNREMQQVNTMRFGSCKARNESFLIPPTIIPVNPLSGMVGVGSEADAGVPVTSETKDAPQGARDPGLQPL